MENTLIFSIKKRKLEVVKRKAWRIKTEFKEKTSRMKEENHQDDKQQKIWKKNKEKVLRKPSREYVPFFLPPSDKSHNTLVLSSSELKGCFRTISVIRSMSHSPSTAFVCICWCGWKSVNKYNTGKHTNSSSSRVLQSWRSQGLYFTISKRYSY